MLTTTYTLLALAYLIGQSYSQRRSVALKPLPIFLLAWAVWAENGSGWLIVGLLLSAAGDIALSLDGDRYFVQGLSFFLLAHVAYVVIFGRKIAFEPLALLPLLMVVLLTWYLLPQLLPNLGNLRLPVLLYVGVLVVMGIAATLHAPFSLLLAFGAIVFIVSDATIAFNKFVRPVPYRDLIVMITYYLAQYMIVIALL